MGELAIKTENAEPIEVMAGLLAVIERAARDPNVDIDKMERLLQMQERVQERNAKTAYFEAMSAMQPNLPTIDENGNIKNKSGGVQSTYALWEDINEVIKPILSEYGFSLTFRGRNTDREVTTVGVLTHCLGYSETSEISLPRDESGSKNIVQSIGSSKSYGKRYAAFDLLNITTRKEDDDGYSTGQPRSKLEKAVDAPVKGERGHPDWPEGPHKNITAMKVFARTLWRDILGAPDLDTLDIILADNSDTFHQMRRGWHDGWTGDGSDENPGFGGLISRRQTELAMIAAAGDGMPIAGAEYTAAG